MDYEPRMVPGLHGAPVEALSLGCPAPGLDAPAGVQVGVHLLIHDLDELRGALRPDAKGRAPRGDMTAVHRLLHKPTPDDDPA